MRTAAEASEATMEAIIGLYEDVLRELRSPRSGPLAHVIVADLTRNVFCLTTTHRDVAIVDEQIIEFLNTISILQIQFKISASMSFTLAY